MEIKNNFSYSGQLFILLAAVLWGTTGTSQALAPAAGTPQSIGALRLLVGGLGLALYALSKHPNMFRQIGFVSVLPAGFFVACYQIFFFWGVSLTGVAVGTMVAIGSAPVFAGIIDTVWFRKPPPVSWLMSTLLAVSGCLILLGFSGSIQIEPVGILLAAGAGFSYALYSFLMKKLLIGRAPESVAALVFCIGALFLLPFLFTADLTWVWTAQGMIVVIHLGLLATSLSYYLFCRGLEKIPVSTVVTLSLAEPFTATILGIIVLHETLDVTGWIGLAMILSGLVILGVPMPRRSLR